MSLSLNLYQSMALAVAIFYFGAFLKSKISVFRTYCIPSPVIGGIIYAIVNLILYQTGVLQLSVDTTLQSVFMNVFFTSVGFTAGFGMLKKGGKSLIVFLVAVCILIGIQDVAGAALCKVFGLQPLLGLGPGLHAPHRRPRHHHRLRPPAGEHGRAERPHRRRGRRYLWSGGR